MSYTLRSFCHPKHTKMSIPHSLVLRLRRICSVDDTFQHRIEELANYLVNRGYKHKFITTENKISRIPKHIALQDTIKHRNDSVLSVVTYNPALRQIPAVLHKYFPVSQSSNRCLKIFTKPPVTAYRRRKNLRDYLVRSKISASTAKQTHIITSNGFHKCNTPNCKTCPYIASNTKTYTFHDTSYRGKIRNTLARAPTISFT